MNRLQSAFKHRPALMPYLTLGYPTPDISLDCVQAAVDAGAEIVELGVPFSDPLADGPVIQHSTQVALENGMTVKKCLEMAEGLRRRGLNVPFVFMGYYNPIFSYGVERYVRDAGNAGVDGFIIPDLPLEEAGELESACGTHGLSFIPMLAPTSTPERIRNAAVRANGFIYLVSVTGVTGERVGLPEGLRQFVGRVRESARTPAAVGFGISTPAQAAEVGKISDGVIIGSAVMRAAGGEAPVRGVREFIKTIREAL